MWQIQFSKHWRTQIFHPRCSSYNAILTLLHQEARLTFTFLTWTWVNLFNFPNQCNTAEVALPGFPKQGHKWWYGFCLSLFLSQDICLWSFEPPVKNSSYPEATMLDRPYRETEKWRESTSIPVPRFLSLPRPGTR